MLTPLGTRLISYATPNAHNGPTLTTEAVGEEGGGLVTTQALGEEGGSPTGATTEAVGEEGGSFGGGRLTTLAVGEEGGTIGGVRPVVTPETVEAVEALRISEIPVELVVQQLAAALARDTFLRGTLSAKKIGELANALVQFENMQTPAGKVIKDFVDAQALPAGSPIATRATAKAKQAPAKNGSNAVVISGKSFPQNVHVGSARIEGDTLIAAVRFGGGFVKEHDIKLHWDGTFLESYPVQVPLTIVDHTVDPAEALLSREVRFDLKPLRDAYASAYRTTSGEMYINIDGEGGALLYKFGAAQNVA